MQQQALAQQQQQVLLQANAMLAHQEMLRKASIMNKGMVFEDASLQIGMNAQFGQGKGMKSSRNHQEIIKKSSKNHQEI